MRRWLGAIAGAALLLLGVGMIALYALLLTHTVGSLKEPSDAALLAGSGAGVAISGAFLLTIRARWRGRSLVPRLCAPALWASLLVFAVALGAGTLAARSARYPGLDPTLAVLAVAATFLFVVRVTTRWGPRDGVAARAVLGPSAWGMSAAVVIALLLELLVFGAVIGAVYAGLYLAGPDIARNAWEHGISDKIDRAGGAIAQTWTVALAGMLIYAVAAPLAEEFAKMLGVLVSLRRRAASEYTVFVAGISAGLGFAAFETLLYGLASADNWPLIVGIRAPIVLVHATGASLSALGWRMQRERGGLALVWHYGAAVLVHAAWNALTVALLIASATSREGEDLSLATGLAALTVLSLMALLLVSCLAWVVLNARRFGRAEAADERERDERARMLVSMSFERGGAFTRAAAGEV